MHDRDGRTLLPIAQVLCLCAMDIAYHAVDIPFVLNRRAAPMFVALRAVSGLSPPAQRGSAREPPLTTQHTHSSTGRGDARPEPECDIPFYP
jgi:hypothetical protein